MSKLKIIYHPDCSQVVELIEVSSEDNAENGFGISLTGNAGVVIDAEVTKMGNGGYCSCELQSIEVDSIAFGRAVRDGLFGGDDGK